MARTIILAWVIGVLGLVMITSGFWGLVDLFKQEVRAPLKSYGGPISMIAAALSGWAWRRSYSVEHPLSESEGCAKRHL